MPDPRVTDPTRPHGEDAHYLDGAPVPHDWTQEISRLVAAVHNLEVAIRQPKRIQQVSAVIAGQLDSSGNGVFPIYQVGAGFYFNLTRLTMEAEGYNPGAAYSANGAYVVVAISDNSRQNPAQGETFDFLPTTQGGQIFPATGDYPDEAGPLARPGEFVLVRVAGGPASKRITVRFQGLLRGVEA